MAVATCPTAETLAAFARGDLTAAELAAVAEHVGDCTACCAALKFVPEDSLAGLARAAAAAPPTLNSGTPAAPGSAGAPAGQPVPAGFVDHPRYRIVGRLGAGGMGTVYKAEDTWMGRTIAIKVVSPHLTAKASALARFRKEVQAAAQLAHQNIIRAYDTGEAGGAQFLVMEFVEGVSLDRLVAKKGPLPVPMACMFTRQAALGLQHAADKGMVHRDIKPQNLMVTRKGQVKILDFGLARFASAEPEEAVQGGRLPFRAAKAAVDAGLTNPNLLMGTPDYLSPEQAKNSHDVDPRSDVYSLGCTLYFLLTGKPPFLGASTLIDKLLAHTQEEPPPVRDLRPEVPEGLAELLARMMAKEPTDRYQKASEAAAALLPFTRSDAEKEPTFEIVEAVVVNPTPFAAATVVTPLPAQGLTEPLAFDTDEGRAGATLADSPRPKRKKKKRRSPWWKRRKWLLAGGLAALLVCVGIVIAATGGKKPADGKSNEPNPDPGASAKRDNPPQPKGGKGEKSNSSKQPTAITPKGGAPKGPGKVLYVLPGDGVWLGDYEPVRKRLEEKGVAVETASTDGGRATVRGNPAAPGVPIDKLFTEGMSLTEYSAVVFAGANIEEYVGSGRGSAAAREVMKKMQQSGKVVAGICIGEGVLAHHGVLRGKSAAHSRHLFDLFPSEKHPYLTGDKSSIKWGQPGQPGVTVDGNIITASGEREAREFADAIVEAISGK